MYAILFINVYVQSKRERTVPYIIPKGEKLCKGWRGKDVWNIPV